MVNTPLEEGQVAYTKEYNLCDPFTFLPVKVVYGYNYIDELCTVDAINADGTLYTGNVSLLVACATGGGGGSINISAGTTSNNLATVVFSNSNGISFGLNGSTITGSIATALTSQSNQALSASNGSFTFQTATFGNSNGLSFYTTNGSIVGSYTVPAAAAAGSISAGTTSAILGQVVFSNSNSVSFGMNAGTVTATVSYPAQTTQPGIQSLSAGTTFISTGQAVFSDSNGISFGANGQTITASHNALTSQSNQALSGSNGSFTFQTATFGNSNAFSFYTTNGSVVGSYTVPSTAGLLSNINVSGGTTSNNLSAITFADSNGVSFGLDGSTITASHNALTSQSNQAISGSNGSFTFQTATFGNSNAFSFYTTNGSIVGSYTVPSTAGLLSAINVSGGTTSNNLSAITFADSNGVSFGLNGSTMTATVKTDYLTTQSAQAFSADVSSTFQTLTLQDSNGISFSNNAGAVRLTHALQFTSNTSNITSNALNTSASRVINIIAATNNTGGGTASLSSNVSFSNANGLTFYTSAGNAIVGSYTVPTQTNQQMTLFATGNTTQSSTGTTNASSIIFAGSGAASVGITGGSVLVSVPNTIAQTNQSLGIYGSSQTTGQSSSSTYDARSLTIVGDGIVSVGWSNSSLRVSATQSNQNVTAGNGGFAFQTLSFSNVNGISFGTSAGSAITASHNAVTSQTNQQITMFATSNTTQSSTGTTNASSVIFAGAGAVSVGITNGSVVVSAPNTIAQTNQTLGMYMSSNTTSSVSSGTVDARSMTFRGMGVASVGYSGGEVIISVPAGAAGSLNVSAGTTSNNLTNITFADSNGISFGLNASTITATVKTDYLTSQSNQNVTAGNGGFAFQTLSFSNANGFSFGTSAGSAITGSYTVPTQTNQQMTLYATSNTTQSSTGTTNASSVIFAGAGAVSVGITGGSIVVSAPNTVAQTAQTMGLYMSSNTTSSISSGTVDARSMTFRGVGVASVGYSAGEVIISVPAGAPSPVNFSAGTTSNNLGSVVFSNSGNISWTLNGSTINASASYSGDGGVFAGVSNIGNTAGSTGTVSTGNFVLVGSNGISLSQSTGAAGSAATVTINGPTLGTLSFYANIPNFQPMVTGGSAITQTSGSSIFVQPFVLPEAVSIGYVRLLASYNDSAVGTGGTTSAATTVSVAGYTTFGMVIYSQGVGASSQSIQSILSTSVGMTGLTQYGAGAQGSQYTITLQKSYPVSGTSSSYTTSYAVSSGSIVISSNSNTLFTGPRFLDIPFATSLSLGNYWIGFGASTSSASNSSIISFAGTGILPISIAGVSASNVSVGLLGAATSASAHQLYPGLGIWTTNASGFTKDSIAISQVSQLVSNRQIPFQFIRQA